jgi:hypothetical protein
MFDWIFTITLHNLLIGIGLAAISAPFGLAFVPDIYDDIFK